MKQLSIHLFPTIDAKLSLSWAWRLPLIGVWCYYFSPFYSLIRCVFCPWLCFLSRQRHDWLAIRCRVALQLTATLLWHFIYHYKPCARNTTSFCGSVFSFFFLKFWIRFLLSFFSHKNEPALTWLASVFESHYVCFLLLSNPYGQRKALSTVSWFKRSPVMLVSASCVSSSSAAITFCLRHN